MLALGGHMHILGFIECCVSAYTVLMLCSLTEQAFGGCSLRQLN